MKHILPVICGLFTVVALPLIAHAEVDFSRAAFQTHRSSSVDTSGEGCAEQKATGHTKSEQTTENLRPRHCENKSTCHHHVPDASWVEGLVPGQRFDPIAHSAPQQTPGSFSDPARIIVRTQQADLAPPPAVPPYLVQQTLLL